MILNVVVEDQTYPITVPDQIITDAEDFFVKLYSLFEGLFFKALALSTSSAAYCLQMLNTNRTP